MQNERSINISGYVSLSAAIITIILGFLVITGWLLDIQVLKSIRSDYVTIKFNTALCFVLAGTAILLILTDRNKYKLRWIANLLSVLIFLIGSISLIEYLFNINLYIDQIFIKEDPEPLHTFSPGRMALNSAINFILISISILLSRKDQEKSAYFSQLFALAAGLIGLMSLLGYGYGISELFGFGKFTKMSVISAIGFITTTVSIISICPGKGFMKSITDNAPGGHMAQILLPFAIIIPLFLVWVREPLEKIGILDPAYNIHQFSILYISLLIILIWFIAEKLNKTEKNRLEAKEKLTESEGKYRSIFENNYTVMLIIEPESGKIIDANSAAEKFYGWSINELKQKKISDINILSLEEIKVEMAKIQKMGKAHFNFKHRLANGEIRDVIVYSGKINIDKNEYFYSIVNDVTAEKVAERKLAGWQSIFNYIIQHAPSSIAVLNKELNYIYVSKRFTEDYGIMDPDIIGKNHYDLFPELPEKWRNVHKRALSGEVLKSDDDFFIRPNGTMYYTRWQCRPWYDENNEIAGILLYTEVINDRKKAELKLIESEEKYRTLIEVSADAIFINYNNTVEYVNPAALKLFGAEDESQIIGKSPFILFHPDFHQKIQERINKMIGNNETVPILHEKIIRIDGRLVDVEVTATPFAYKGDKAIQVILRDISERVESESLLRETQQRFRATFDQAAVGIALVAPDGRWLQVNQRFCDITGYSSHELLQLTFQDVTYPDDLPADLRYVEQMLSGQISDYMMEKRYIRKDKSNIWVNLTVSLVKDEQDKPKYFISLVEDISARKNSEEEIKVINTRLQVLIEALSNLASARNIEQVRSIIATSARNLTGADGATIVFADGDQSYYAEEDAVEPLWVGRTFPLNECISGWVMLNNQHVVIPDIYADNRIPHHIYRPTFVKSLVMVPVKTAKPIAAIGNYWREWHEASENEIRLLQSLADAAGSVIDNITLYEDLEKRVEHRTRELHIVNKELESFAYTVSHDLRAPLRAISGFTKILLEDYSNNWDEEANRLFNVIRVNSEKMNQLIDDLLAFSRVGRAEMLQAKVSMKQLADQVVFEIQANNNYSNVQITIGQLPDSYGDQPLLKQVWTNLISNAFKYSSKARKPEIHIGSMEKDHQTTYFIKDNGVGFNMEYKDKLFNVFERLHNTREFEGTGVGLAIVQRIVQRHGGTYGPRERRTKGQHFTSACLTIIRLFNISVLRTFGLMDAFYNYKYSGCAAPTIL